MSFLKKIHLDLFVILIIGVVILASFFPVEGNAEIFLKNLSKIGIALLFFMHGAKLSREAIIGGITLWRVHLLIISITFVVFPLLGILLHFLEGSFLKSEIYNGFLFLCVLPSTVQSSVIFTSTAQGNVAAAICSASISSVLGVFVSPFLAGLLLNSADSTMQIDFLGSVSEIFMQLIFPFLVGHLMRPLVGNWVDKNRKVLKISDQFAILLVVYLAFGKAVVDGLWNRVSFADLCLILVLSVLMLLLVISLARKISKWLKINIKEEIVMVFCGSKKSLVNGVPMAQILFAPHLVGVMLLPLMVFHQVQLIVSAIIANKYANNFASSSKK